MIDAESIRRDFYVYQYSRDGIPVYIGKGCGKRWLRHASVTGHNQILYRMIQKDRREGTARITVRKVQEGLTEAEAFLVERELIALYGRRPAGSLVNGTDGGEGASGRDPGLQAKISAAVSRSLMGHPVSEETRAKLRDLNLGRPRAPEVVAKTAEANRGKKRTQEQRARFSKAQLGNKNSLGRVCTLEMRERLRAKQAGRKSLPEWVAKAAAANTGKKRTAEQREAMSRARRGKPCSEAAKLASSRAHKGKPKSLEQREKQRLAMTGRKQTPEAVERRRVSFQAAMERRRAAKAMAAE